MIHSADDAALLPKRHSAPMELEIACKICRRRNKKAAEQTLFGGFFYAV
jgi:hypothetical protein